MHVNQRKTTQAKTSLYLERSKSKNGGKIKRATNLQCTDDTDVKRNKYMHVRIHK